MQVLGERSTSGNTDPGAPTGSEAPGRAVAGSDSIRPERRRGSRARARTFLLRSKRARRRAWDRQTPQLPEPLLTVPMAYADPAPAGPGTELQPPAGPGGDRDDTPAEQSDDPADDSGDDLGDTAEWQARSVFAIDLSDHPRLIVHPASRPASPAGPPGFVPAQNVPAAAATPIPQPPQASQVPPVAAADLLAPPVSRPASPPRPPSTLDLVAGLRTGSSATARFATAAADRNQLPDPVQLATEPSRLPEAMLAAVLGIVAGLAAWGTAAPQGVWIPLAALPAVGLIALLLPGGHWARVARAGAMLAAATTLPVLAPAMTPVTLVVALSAAALYPMLVSSSAGRVVTMLAMGCLAGPLAVAALLDGPVDFFRFLLAADGDPTTAVRLALGSGIPVVALVGGSTMAARRTLTRTASVAVTRERTARAATARLGAAASCDATTGLPNRESLLRALTITLADGDRLRHPSAGPVHAIPAHLGRVGVVLIEIERFAELAGSLGSAIADDVAELVAVRLRGGFGAPAMLARVSRHQFVLMLQDATHDSCGDLAREITALMTAPVIAGDRDLSVTCSIGAVLAGPGLRTADDLLQAADEAARAAQRSGRSRWVMFDQTVRAHALDQATLEIELRDAVRLGAIDVAFQPVLAFGTRAFGNGQGDDDRIVGAEVLARWTREDGTVIEPRRFIPVADELGLGVALGMQVIGHGLTALIGWRRDGLDIEQVWVNLAPSQLEDPEFAHEVAAQLAIRGLASSCLVLEISAGDLVESEQCLSTLGMLRSLGIAVALDDFGRGGTSLSALRRLPISAVKLDPSLAAELGRHDAVPKAIAQLCRTLGLRVVVEGVETMVQLRGARQIEADAVQGFAIARPMSAEDITNLLTLRLPREFRLR